MNKPKDTRKPAHKKPGPKKTGGKPSGPNPRRMAADLLDQVIEDKEPLDLAFATLMDGPQGKALAPRDRAFVRALVTTALRRRGQVDEAAKRYLTRALPAKAHKARQILRLAVTEILFLDTPPHAAVSEALRLADKHPRTRAFKGVFNAVLRRVSENKEDILKSQDAPALNTPHWLWESWSDTYGEDSARAIAQAHLSEAPLDLVVKDKEDASRLAETLDAEILPTGSLRRASGGAVTILPEFDAGTWWVQDAAAALPARLFGAVKGEQVIDLCAAPGGKTAQLSAAGAHVIALDRARPRIALLKQNLKRLKLEAQVVKADALTWRPESRAKFVLLDAPCTATGTLRRHPDVAHGKRPADIASAAQLQTQLLVAAAAMTAPGGMLVYCTCSLQKEEGEDQIDAFLEKHPNWRRQPIDAQEIGVAAQMVTEAGDLRTLPNHWPEYGGLDGFFAARLVLQG